MAPVTVAQLSMNRWSKALLVGCVLVILFSTATLLGCGSSQSQLQQKGQTEPEMHIMIESDQDLGPLEQEQDVHGKTQIPHGADSSKGCCIQRVIAAFSLATGLAGAVVAFRPSQCAVALFLFGLVVTQIVWLALVSYHIVDEAHRCAERAHSEEEAIAACGALGSRQTIFFALIFCINTLICGCFGYCAIRALRQRELQDRVEAEAKADVPIVVGSCEPAPLPDFASAVEGTACVDEVPTCTV